MKSVVANASEIFENLVAKFKASDTDKKIQKQTNQILFKLQRAKNTFHSENLEQFKNLNVNGKKIQRIIWKSSRNFCKKIGMDCRVKYRLNTSEILRTIST